MTEGRHYRIDFVTFSRILGFDEEHQGFTYIHDEARLEIHDIAYMWIDRGDTNRKVSGLQSYYYILNNLIRHTFNPKDGAASDLNGYMRNVLARFAPRGDRFNVPRFMWCELRNAIEDGRQGIPYAPYLMFMIERVTGYRFKKDGLHTVYKIEKTQGAGASRTVRCSPSVEDMPESSCSRPCKEKKMEKFGKWIKAIFTTCTYAARTAYQDWLENYEANREAREHVGLPPLSPV